MNNNENAMLADLIDRLMSEGTGHVNVFADGSDRISVETIKTTECQAEACIRSSKNEEE